MSERHLTEQRCPAGDIADHWHGSPALAGGYSILSRQRFFLSANTWPLLSLTCNLISLDAWGSCERRANLLNIYRKVFCFCPTAKNHQEKILFPLVWARNLFMKLNSCFLLAMLSFGKSSWSQYYHPFPSGFTFYCKHSLVATDLQRWLVLGVGNSHAFLLLSPELIVLLSLSTGMTALRTFFQSPLRPGAPLTLVVPELNMLPVASPKGSILPGRWDSQEASAEGEPGGKQVPQPALAGWLQVPWDSVPGGAGMTESCLHLPCWEWLEGFLALQSRLVSNGNMPWGLKVCSQKCKAWWIRCLWLQIESGVKKMHLWKSACNERWGRQAMPE